MGRDFIPEADASTALWMRCFADGIAAAPWVYMLSPANAASISAVVGRYVSALAVASSESTRTRPSVLAKDEARNAAKQLIRQYAALIKHNAGISDADKIAIGVPPVNPNRTRRHAPATSPKVDVISATNGVHVLTFGDSIIPGRAMPFGATSLQLFVAIADEPADGVGEARFCASLTKKPTNIPHVPADAGKVATYFGRWASRRGEFGPWSLPTSMRIAA